MPHTLEQELPGVRRNVSLAPYTTFRIGGRARYFYLARTEQEIVRAVKAAKRSRTPFFVLAGGSNVLVSDKGFNGLVIKLHTTRYAIRTTRLSAEAGVPMAVLVRETGKKGLAGLEWAGGLPGSVGGAVRGNAGAFQGEIKDSVLAVRALDRTGAIRTFTQKQCRFAYRSSVFKKRKWLVLSVSLLLRKGDAKTIQAVARDHIRYRKERHPLEFPNAGSVFQNCDIKKFSLKLQTALQEKIKKDPFPVIPTAVLVARAHLQGTRQGNAQISTKHTNYIVNLGDARSDDVIRLINRTKKIIKKKFFVDVEQEIEYLS